MRERQISLLQRDLDGIDAFLTEFEPPSNDEARSVETNSTGELVVVRNFPLPEGFEPDFVDVLLLVQDYPNTPPIGVYILEKNNAAAIAQLRRLFNVMQTAAHSAPTVKGYAWVCFVHQGNHWRFNRHDVARGDNLRKFLIGFFNRCSTNGGAGHGY